MIERFSVDGLDVSYDAAEQVLTINGLRLHRRALLQLAEHASALPPGSSLTVNGSICRTLPAAELPSCTPETPCCERRDQYNGYGSDGPTTFTCPRSCGCHD